MKFTAFPVKEGDSFLLEYESKKILVDTGKDYSECTNFLHKNEIQSIDSVIISHYDSDHVNGLIELIKSNINISEIWLPNEYQAIRRYYKEYQEKIQRREQKEIQKNRDKSELHWYINRELEKSDESEIITTIDVPNQLLKHIPNGEFSFEDKSEWYDLHKEFRRFHRYCHEFDCYPFHRLFYDEDYFNHYMGDFQFQEKLFDHLQNAKKWIAYIENWLIFNNIGISTPNFIPLKTILKRQNRQIKYVNKNHLIKIDEIISNCESKKIPIKWLEYNSQLETPQIISAQIPIKGINCKVGELTIISSGDDCLKYLTRINKESLVFLFDNENLPNILFSADSDLKFTENEGIVLKTNSLVTAPHHGSSDNSIAYSLIKGENLLYVRSDRKNEKRPCNEYKSLPKKICTICNNENLATQITLEFQNENWVGTDRICKCI